jgi:hypothetical protein
MTPDPASPTSTPAVVVARATMAAAIAALVALAALLAALAWPAGSRFALASLLAVPLVRNLVLAVGARGRDRLLAVFGIALLLVTAVVALR